MELTSSLSLCLSDWSEVLRWTSQCTRGRDRDAHLQPNTNRTTFLSRLLFPSLLFSLFVSSGFILGLLLSTLTLLCISFVPYPLLSLRFRFSPSDPPRSAFDTIFVSRSHIPASQLARTFLVYRKKQEQARGLQKVSQVSTLGPLPPSRVSDANRSLCSLRRDVTSEESSIEDSSCSQPDRSARAHWVPSLAG